MAETPGLDAPRSEFSFTRPEKVILGPVSSLAAELERRNVARAVVVTGKSLGASKLLEQVTTAMGPRCAGVFKGISQHVPISSVRALTEELRRHDADAVVSFGGPSLSRALNRA